MRQYKKALFIYNPISGNRRIASNLDEIIRRLMQKDVLIIPVRLEDKTYDAIDQMLLSINYDFVIASGGDGTIASVANRMIKNKIDKPFAAIGSGTCNNFASNIQMPQDLFENIDEIAKQNIDKVDVGMLESGEVFLSSLAVGVFAETSFDTNSELKGWLGPLAYYLHGITQLKNIKASNFKIIADDEIIEEKAYMVLVLNGTNVGNISGVLQNKANIQDGLFELIIVKVANPVEIANLLMKVVKGEDFTQSNLITVKMCSHFEIDADDRKLAVALDGEKGPSLPICVNVAPKEIKVIVGEVSKVSKNA